MTSDGDSPEYQGAMMGLYKLMSRFHHNAPAYKQVHTIPGTQPNYIYKTLSGNWLHSGEYQIKSLFLDPLSHGI